MKKFKDFLYDKNDIIIALLILVIASLLIIWRMEAIMEYPKTLISDTESTSTELDLSLIHIQMCIRDSLLSGRKFEEFHQGVVSLFIEHREVHLIKPFMIVCSDSREEGVVSCSKRQSGYIALIYLLSVQRYFPLESQKSHYTFHQGSLACSCLLYTSRCV